MSYLTLPPLAIPLFFMHDNARSHTAQLLENMLQMETVYSIEWTAAYSPDLNPIEDVWNTFKRRVALRPMPPLTIRDLEIPFLEVGNEILQSLIKKLTASIVIYIYPSWCFGVPLHALDIFSKN